MTDCQCRALDDAGIKIGLRVKRGQDGGAEIYRIVVMGCISGAPDFVAKSMVVARAFMAGFCEGRIR